MRHIFLFFVLVYGVEAYCGEVYSKIMLLIDKSGSNVQSDSQFEIRYERLKRLIDKNQGNRFVKWNITVFSGTSSQSLIVGRNGAPLFTNDESLVHEALKQILLRSDSGATPFYSALKMAQQAIAIDQIEAVGEDSYYYIFNVSDGMPTDCQSIDDVYWDVKDILKMSNGRAFISALYYGGRPESPRRFMKRLAEIGNGKFIDTDIEPQFTYEMLLPF